MTVDCNILQRDKQLSEIVYFQNEMYNIIVTYYHVMALTQRGIIGILCTSILNALSHININGTIPV